LRLIRIGSSCPGQSMSSRKVAWLMVLSSISLIPVLSAPSRKCSSSTTLVLPTALRLWSGVEVAVRSATIRLSLGRKRTVRKRGSSDPSSRSMGALPEHKDVVAEFDHSQRVEDVEGQDEPPEGNGGGVPVLGSPLLEPPPRLGDGDGLVFRG